MAEREVDHLLIGGGLASANCARWLREAGGRDSSIMLVGRELDPPYNRPPLSKGYLRGSESKQDALFRPDEWWAEQDIELLTRTSVMKLDAEARVATLSSKDTVRFDKALIATGANVRRLRVDGAELDGIHYLRAFGNSDSIRDDVKDAERVVLVGGSFIGVECAASITAAFGAQCVIVMQERETFDHQFGSEVGGFFHRVLNEHGVEIHGEDELDRFEGADGRVTHVHTKGGLEIDCDAVIIGAGVMPDVNLARAAGLEIGESGGIACSSKLETSVPGIYAAGDICEYDSVVHGRRLRVEHWDVAFNQGKTAALNMLGQGLDHDVIPYFFSDIADWASMEYVGPGDGAPVVRGSLDGGDFTAFYVAEDGAVTAALTVGRSDDLEHARRFIREKAKPDPAALADEASDLSGL